MQRVDCQLGGLSTFTPHSLAKFSNFFFVLTVSAVVKLTWWSKCTNPDAESTTMVSTGALVFAFLFPFSVAQSARKVGLALVHTDQLSGFHVVSTDCHVILANSWLCPCSRASSLFSQLTCSAEWAFTTAHFCCLVLLSTEVQVSRFLMFLGNLCKGFGSISCSSVLGDDATVTTLSEILSSFDLLRQQLRAIACVVARNSHSSMVNPATFLCFLQMLMSPALKEDCWLFDRGTDECNPLCQGRVFTQSLLHMRQTLPLLLEVGLRRKESDFCLGCIMGLTLDCHF